MQASEDELQRMMVGGLDGDAAAHRALLRALVPLLRRFFARRLRDADGEVDDLVQETLMAIHTRRGTYDRTRPFAPWAFAVARHKMIDHFRRHRQHLSIDGLDDILVTEGFEAASGAAMDVDHLLATIPDKQAQAIRDTRVEGLSIVEAAERRGMSESDVKVSVHRGLRALAARLRGNQ